MITTHPVSTDPAAVPIGIAVSARDYQEDWQRRRRDRRFISLRLPGPQDLSRGCSNLELLPPDQASAMA